MGFRQYLKSNTGRRNIRALGFFVAFYFGLMVFTALSQERLVYQPSEQVFADCPTMSAYGLHPQVFNDTRFYAPTNLSSSSQVVVIYHGNAGSACNRTYYLPYLEETGSEAIFVEYAGYSNDLQTPSHDAIKNDVANITTFLEQSNMSNVVVLGESIGTGPAVLHASQLPPKQLVLITPFTSLKDLARHHYWYFPTDLLVDNAFDNLETLRLYSGPRSIIHGANDEIIPVSMSEELTTLAPEQTTLTIVDNANHNNLLNYPEFVEALRIALSSER